MYGQPVDMSVVCEAQMRWENASYPALPRKDGSYQKLWSVRGFFRELCQCFDRAAAYVAQEAERQPLRRDHHPKGGRAMPLIIPQALPAYHALEEENVFVMHRARAMTQDIRPLRILLVNLMPTKIATETQIARMLANSPLQVELTLLHMGTHESAHVSGAHLQAFYKTFAQVRGERFDGMIVTGAPVEQLAFEAVDYWPELCEVFRYSKTHVYSTVHICWGAQAALYYHYGIHKRMLPQKLSGVFAHTVTRPKSPLVRGFDEVFYAPHSRHTEVCREEVEACGALRVLAESQRAGLHLVTTDSGRQIFVFGHMEYDRDTLRLEYERDRAKGLPAAVPEHYFTDDDPSKGVLFRWRSHANLFFTNWLNYYVYQTTPYDLSHLPEVDGSV